MFSPIPPMSSSILCKFLHLLISQFPDSCLCLLFNFTLGLQRLFLPGEGKAAWVVTVRFAERARVERKKRQVLDLMIIYLICYRVTGVGYVSDLKKKKRISPGCGLCLWRKVFWFGFDAMAFAQERGWTREDLA